MDRPRNQTESDTPTLRLLRLLEIIANHDRLMTLSELIEATGLPKPTVHRMLQQMESTGIVQRDGDTRHYTTGLRLRRLAENVLLNSTLHDGRHAILSQLVHEIGESCNITTLSGNQVLYLDRVETAEPLRFYLHPGSRVPMHCSSSGKLLLSQMSDIQRHRLLTHLPLERFTDNTLTSADDLTAELRRIQDDGYATNNEEFLPGLFGIAIPVPRVNGRPNLAVAVQAPTIRLGPERVAALLPTLRRAAHAIAETDSEFDAKTAAPSQPARG